MNVDLEGQFPFLVRNILDRFEAGLVRGVVDEDVDAVEFGHRLCDHRAAVIGGLQIASNKDGLPSGLLDVTRGVAGVAIFVEI